VAVPLWVKSRRELRQEAETARREAVAKASAALRGRLHRARRASSEGRGTSR
jgi:vacuolar-type H+-ATPase subunit E/Vma4